MTQLFFDTENTPKGRVANDSAGNVLIQNISNERWTVETPSGKLKTVETQGFMPAKPGLKISVNFHNSQVIMEIQKKKYY